MVERSARPAVLAAGWRSRPGVVRVAAVLLGLFGVLLALVEAEQGDLDAAEVVTALVLVAAAVSLIWAGRLGYWIGLAAASLVAMLLLVVLARRPGVAGAVVTAVCALPLVLLAVPAARRPRPTTRPAPSSAALERPPGWTRSSTGGWGQFVLLVSISGLLSVGGLVLALTGQGADRGAGATTALFFLACLLVAPLVAPGRRRGQLRLETLRVCNRHERGVVVPYSGLRTGVLLVATACLALAMGGFVVFAGASAVVIVMGGARTVVPWAAIQQVRATEVTTYARGVRISEPLVGIDLSDPQAIQTGPLERLLLPLNRRLAADITLPIRTLDIDPPLLYEALCYYHRHPQARAELATQDGLARVQHGQLT